MAGIAIVLDLLKKSSNVNSKQTFHSSGLYSASAAASAAAISVAASAPFASRFLFGDSKIPVAYCDAGAAITDDYISSIRRISGDLFPHESIAYATKEYNIEPKPLFSAFEIRTFAITSLRSFLMFYLPLLEPKTGEDDDDFLQDATEEKRVDLVVPFKKSLKQIGRETTVVTTRRVLERLAMHHVSQRMAWKLLKDVPKSAVRKAQRGLPSHVYIFRVGKTTLRGHFLGVAASWVVQVGIEVYRCISQVTKSEEVEVNEVNAKSIQARLLGKKITGITIRCGASLVFASIGAGIGACLVRPSAGQWIGCAIGDLAGPIAVSFFLEKALQYDL